MNVCVILVAVAAFGSLLQSQGVSCRTQASSDFILFLKQIMLETEQTVTHSRCVMLLIFDMAPSGAHKTWDITA